MSENFTQKDRLIAIETPLGPDRLLLRSFTGAESMSRLFRFRLDMASTDFAIDFDAIIGRNVTVRILLEGGTKERYFNGVISRFAQLPVEGHLAHYEAEMVPAFWFLTLTSDCRIFQNKTVPTIIEEIFKEYGLQNFENQTLNKYDPWEYCVQYRETAWNFVTRLMEQEGIFFFFRHERGKHILVMADRPSANKPLPNQPKVRYEHARGEGVAREEDVILDWRCEREFGPGKYSLGDFNFETPKLNLASTVATQEERMGNRKYEVFDYPGEYEKRDEGEEVARLRMEEREAFQTVIHGSGNCRDFTSGFRFTLYDHDRRDQNTTYLITSVTHTGHSGGFYMGAEPGAGTYSNLFTCIPHAVPFRPPRTTPKPVIDGPQTAVVTGPPGEEIFTDKYGRVKVKFHWDRKGSSDDKSSCWIRVSQPWAGRNWGGIWNPRIGQEVIVDFLEGDPDRPIITGRVYNAEQMPPYALPANQTQSGFKSRSSKGGGSENYNEIRFEDKKGAEEIVIHAERNLSTTVEANESRSVGGKRTTAIKKDETLVVSDGNRKETLEKGNDTLEIWQGNRDVTLMKGNDSLMAQTGNIDVKAPAGTHSTSAMKVEITGSATVNITCGGSAIKMTPASIDITSPLINIKGGLVKINC
jgi:type VI secretion system secreted protein VgrG